MQTNSKRHGVALIIIWCLIWASSVVASAYFFKLNPGKSWIEAGINLVGVLVFLVLATRLRPRSS